MKIGSGRGPGTTPGDPEKLKDARTPYVLVGPWEVGAPSASQGRFLSDFGVILGSLFKHFLAHFGS